VGITQLFQRGINPFDELGLELVAPQRVVGGVLHGAVLVPRAKGCDAVEEQVAHVDAEERFGEWCRRLRHLWPNEQWVEVYGGVSGRGVLICACNFINNKKLLNPFP
jgi:hypothetical protein